MFSVLTMYIATNANVQPCKADQNSNECKLNVRNLTSYLKIWQNSHFTWYSAKLNVRYLTFQQIDSICHTSRFTCGNASKVTSGIQNVEILIFHLKSSMESIFITHIGSGVVKSKPVVKKKLNLYLWLFASLFSRIPRMELSMD